MGLKTRELLDKIYNGAGSAISQFEAKNLKYKISGEMEEFAECIDNYLNENDAKLRIVYWKRIEKMLRRESEFSGFKRSIVRESEELMECFSGLLI